ncbi:MAG: hypothetical protein A2286_06135 [Gammaproteobacteria bacterium RIFOXYA12_FULL_61_12]|nr:MAG: hypothetical protein A2286_06135 [Gammaproteobacteria bacterium RIFOXYA12_FULL_61_12]OGT88573.1 MAG: hypothetical protein A2514_09810 [Gammaproteobacteria bacterium RIFOXYD12_FULL_61_37]
MSPINNDWQFKHALDDMDGYHQRQVAALFVRNVLDLNPDPRVLKALEVASNYDSDPDEMNSTIKSIMQAVLESHARCGAACKWSDQAGYYVARAAAACLTPRSFTLGKDPAWQAALSCRMARTSATLDCLDCEPVTESLKQHKILSDYLESLKGTEP